MKFKPTNLRSSLGNPPRPPRAPVTASGLVGRRRGRGLGFTLAEVLAALAFMAIVIPVAVEGLRVANAAGVLAERKLAATEIAEQVLNETILTGRWLGTAPQGAVWRNEVAYEYSIRTEAWSRDPLQRDLQTVTVEVVFLVQGRTYQVTLDTLAGGTAL